MGESSGTNEKSSAVSRANLGGILTRNLEEVL